MSCAPIMAHDDEPAQPELIDVGRVVEVPGRLTAMGPERSAEVLQRIAPVVGAALGRNAA